MWHLKPGRIVVFVLVIMLLPPIGFLRFVDLPFHLAEHLLLKGSEAAVEIQGSLVRLGKGIKLDELPLGKTLRFPDGGEGIAGKLGRPVGSAAVKLTVFALNHGKPVSGTAKGKASVEHCTPCSRPTPPAAAGASESRRTGYL
jgi:hypothetical protein